MTVSGGAAGFPRCDGTPTFSDGKPFHEGCLAPSPAGIPPALILRCTRLLKQGQQPRRRIKWRSASVIRMRQVSRD